MQGSTQNICLVLEEQDFQDFRVYMLCFAIVRKFLDETGEGAA